MNIRIMSVFLALVLVFSFGLAAAPIAAQGPEEPSSVPVEEGYSQASRSDSTGTVVKSISINPPANTSEGDLLVAAISWDDNPGAITLPIGWTKLDEGSYKSDDGIFPGVTTGIYYRIAASEETGPYTWTWKHTQSVYAFIIRITGQNAEAPIQDWEVDQGYSVKPTSPSVDTTENNTLVLRIFGANRTSSQISYPGNHTGIVQGSSGGSWDFWETTGAAAYKNQENAGATGSAVFTITGWPLYSDWRAYTIVISPAKVPVNEAPEAVDDAYSTDEDAPLDIASPGVLENDTDANGDTLTVTLVDDVDNGSLTLNADGSFIYVPAEDFNGTDTFTYKTSDGEADSNVAAVTITIDPVNDAPFAADQSVTTDEDAPRAITLTGSDIDGDSLTYEIVTNPAYGTLTGTAPELTYTPAANFSGADSFTFKVNDGTVDSNIAAVSITVYPVNDLPSAVNDTAVVTEDSIDNVIAVLDNDSDVEGDTLSVVSISDPGHGTASLIDGVIKYTPAADFNGTDSFTYYISDGQGGTAEASVTITVTPVNDAPDFTAGSSQVVVVNSGEQVAAGWAADISAGPADEIGQALSFIVTNNNESLFSVQPAVSSDGTLTYTPAVDAIGVAEISIQIQDDDTIDGTAAVSEIKTFTITVGVVVQGLTFNVLGDALDEVSITLDEAGTPVVGNIETGYQVFVASLGAHQLTAEKDGYFAETIEFTLSDINGLTVDFKGDTGLVPSYIDSEMFEACKNKYLYPQTDGTDLGLEKFLEIINIYVNQVAV